MGWLWSSSAPPASSAAAQEKSASIAPLSTPEAPAATPQSAASSTPKPLSRDELAEQELQSFLNEINADAKPSSTKYNRVPRAVPSSNSKSATPSAALRSLQPTSSTDNNSNSDEPLAEQLLPTTMSCRTAFDAAFYCNSFGGRFNDLYRYGNLRSCSDTWGDFWFCMRTRTYTSPSKEEAIKEHYRQKESMKYSKALGRDSSEDVWRSRDKKMEWGEAFGTEFQEFEGTDEEWRRAQREWRAKERGAIGKDESES